MSDWFAQVRAQPVSVVAAWFGFEVRKQGNDFSFSCPMCAKELRHSKGSDKRYSAKIVREGHGWWCEPCRSKGGAVELVAAFVTGRLKPTEWSEVWRQSAAAGWCEPNPRDTQPPLARRFRPLPAQEVALLKPSRLPETEVAALWGACMPLNAVPLWDSGSWCGSAREYLTGRGYDVGQLAGLDLVRIMPPSARYTWPSWWPSSWSKAWRLAVPLFDANGAMVGLQARAIEAKEAKTLNPKDSSISRTFFADAGGLEVLRGTWAGPSLVVVEGLTDFLAAAQLVATLEPKRRPAVLGIVQGSAAALATVMIPSSCRLVVATDNDDTGNKYAQEVKSALPRAHRFRVRWPLLDGKQSDLSDYFKQYPAKALKTLAHGEGGTHGK